jgi:hypothetical protein
MSSFSDASSVARLADPESGPLARIGSPLRSPPALGALKYPLGRRSVQWRTMPI